MAGIGFQLKKLFIKKGIGANIKAYLYSTVVTIGPTLMGMVMTMLITIALEKAGATEEEIEGLQTTIMYSFIFSLIITNGYCMVLSRYVSNKIYEKIYEDILASLKGAMAVIAVIAGVIGIIFYWNAKIELLYKFLSFILFMQAIVVSILNTYISALKNYKKVALGYLIGLLISIILEFIVLKFIKENLILITLVNINIGFLIINSTLAFEAKRNFTAKSKKYFEFIKSYKPYILIFLTNCFWILGLYGHNFVIWIFSDVKKIVLNTYVYTPIYDIPCFYAFITILPTLIIFVVKLETEFFVKYSNYFHFINNGAAYDDMELMKNNMKDVLYKEIVYLMIIQLFFTLAGIIIGIEVLPEVGFSRYMLNLYNLLCLGYYCAINMFVIMTILLYFEDKLGAAFSTFIFFSVSTILTLIFLVLGKEYYGVGFCIGALSSLVFSILRVRYFINDIDYYIFCKNSSWAE